MRFPLLIRHRRAEAKIYGKRPKYPWYRLAYYARGKRVVRQFSKLAAARAEAERVVRELADGSDGPALTAKAARGALIALDKLRDLSHAIGLPKAPSIEEAVAEFVEAKQLLGDRSLAEAVQGFLSTQANVQRVPVKAAVEEFLAEREARTRPEKEGARPQLSARHVYQERNRLDRFAAHFASDVCDLRVEHFDLFFREHLRELSPRSRNHWRSAFRTWLKWCVRKSYLSKTHTCLESQGLSPDGKSKEKAQCEEVELYTAAELATLLTGAQGEQRALIALCAFAGLRTAEALRLEWPDLWRRPGYIEIAARKAKTRARRLVPVCESLAAWLAPFRVFTEGRLWPFRENEYHVRFREMAARVGVTRKDNGLRHGWISCRLALIHNEHQVAQEAGTSPTMIHQHYRELCTVEDSREWFNVLPDGAARNIVLMGKEKLA